MKVETNVKISKKFACAGDIIRVKSANAEIIYHYLIVDDDTQFLLVLLNYPDVAPRRIDKFPQSDDKIPFDAIPRYFTYEYNWITVAKRVNSIEIHANTNDTVELVNI